MIFIAYNREGQVTSIVSAKTEESALAYWQGRGSLPYSHKSFDLSQDRENEKLGFVTPIMNTKEIEVYSPHDRYRQIKILTIDKN